MILSIMPTHSRKFKICASEYSKVWWKTHYIPLYLSIDSGSCILHIQNVILSSVKMCYPCSNYDLGYHWLIHGFVHSWLSLMSLLFTWFINTSETGTQLFSLLKMFYHCHHQNVQLTQIKEQGGKGIVQDEVTVVTVDGDAAH